MATSDWLATEFEAHRTHLRAVAYRMLGSLSEADDAVQEAWLRLSRADTSEIANLGGWLMTVVARVCLDALRTRAARREEPLEVRVDAPLAVTSDQADQADPERQALLADSIGLALLVVLETLSPAERLAFVLHDLFAVPFEEIAPIVGRSPEAARQLASRARRRVRGAPADPDADLSGQRAIVSAFLTAARGGDFDALLALLDPEVALRADRAAAAMGTAEARGADAVARTFAGRARAARLALVEGATGLVWAQGGQVRVAFRFTLAGSKITVIDMIADAERLARLAITPLDG
jgi:RNA polymerase sigma-70 factor (ECF subfamily)